MQARLPERAMECESSMFWFSGFLLQVFVERQLLWAEAVLARQEFMRFSSCRVHDVRDQILKSAGNT